MLAGDPEGADDDELSEHPDAISAVLRHRAVKNTDVFSHRTRVFNYFFQFVLSF